MAQNHNLTAKDQFQVLKRLIKYTFPFKGIILLAFIMLTISTIASIATPYMVKVFITGFNNL